MEKTTFENPDIIKLINEKYYPVELDVDKNSDVADTYQIMDLPTIIIFDMDGKSQMILTGYIKADEMLKKLQ
jgi:thioredoxin-related protein